MADWTCRCGSGLRKRDLLDARGIFCTYVCDKCEREQMRKYRADVFTDADYWHDEPIDDD